MVGAGIFTTSGLLMADLHNPLVMLGLWLVGGLVALCGALSYGELGAAFPHAGGEYAFLSRLYHPVLGFLSGWVSFFVGFSAPIAASAIGFSEYLTRAFPGLLHPGLIPGPREAAAMKKLYAILIIAAFTFLHTRGLEAGRPGPERPDRAEDPPHRRSRRRGLRLRKGEPGPSHRRGAVPLRLRRHQDDGPVADVDHVRLQRLERLGLRRLRGPRPLAQPAAVAPPRDGRGHGPLRRPQPLLRLRHPAGPDGRRHLRRRAGRREPVRQVRRDRPVPPHLVRPLLLPQRLPHPRAARLLLDGPGRHLLQVHRLCRSEVQRADPVDRPAGRRSPRSWSSSGPSSSS